MLKRLEFWFVFGALATCALPAARALEPSQVLLLVNKDTGISSRVAQMYQKLRNVPEANVLKLSLGTDRLVTPEEYWSRTAPAVRKALEANPEIRCILTTAGVPYFIAPRDGKQGEGAAFDNELAAVLRNQPDQRKWRQPNPLFLEEGNPFGITDPRKLQMVFVVRLDGPDVKTITRMVEDAISVEQTGFQGPVFGDTQGSQSISGYGQGDASIRAAVDELAGAGFPSTLDMKPESWTQPKGGVGDQAAGAAFYVGWYNLGNFQDIFGPQGLARGAIAWHIASGEAVNIWDVDGNRAWCINLMRRGAAVTLGPAFEPYVEAFPHGGIFADALLNGLSVAEGYWLALPNVSWAMVVLGDPLYRPFALNPKPSLVARAYIKEGGNHVLEKGQTAPLLVQVECVVRPGFRCPAVNASAEPELGLAAASGTVSIPALASGESAFVRVPSVTAGADPTGLFRLRLKSQQEDGPARVITLEGRIGFSKLTGGLSSKSQLAIAPDGSQLIAGQPGRTMMVDANTLKMHPLNASDGYVVTAAEFSPDGEHMVVGMLNPQQKKAGVLIVDTKSGSNVSLPPDSQFLRWMSKDEVLLRSKSGVFRHSLTGAPDHEFPLPEGWSTPLAGTVIAGTNTQFLISADGRVGVKSESEPYREVLEGTQVKRFVAVANDLSAFGGVDSEKRLWIQHGLNAKPERVAEGVERVIWGPISHRAVVEDARNNGRVYDTRDGSWIDLGVVSGVQWSPNEKELLYIDSSGYLSLLRNRTPEKICSMAIIGKLRGAAISADGDRAFLLAGLDGALNVWQLALPETTRK